MWPSWPWQSITVKDQTGITQYAPEAGPDPLLGHGNKTQRAGNRKRGWVSLDSTKSWSWEPEANSKAGVTPGFKVGREA